MILTPFNAPRTKPRVRWLGTMSRENAHGMALDFDLMVRKNVFPDRVKVCGYDISRRVHWVRADDLCYAFFDGGAHVFLIVSKA